MKYFSYMLTLLLLISAAEAKPSWCKKARTSMEKTICQDDSLSSFDDELSGLYSELKRYYPNEAWIKRSQKKWLKGRKKKRKSLYRYYILRIQALKSFDQKRNNYLKSYPFQSRMREEVASIKKDASLNYFRKFSKEQKEWEDSVFRKCKAQKDQKTCLESAYTQRFDVLENLPVFIVDAKGCIPLKTQKMNAKVEDICTEEVSILNKNMRKNLLNAPLEEGVFLDDVYRPKASNCKVSDNEERTESQYGEAVSSLLDNVVVIYKNTYVYAGGAHGNNFGGSYIYDRNDASSITWHTLFGKNKKFEKYVYRTAKAKLIGKDAMAIPDRETIMHFKKVGYYSITAKGLRIVYPPYEMGSYAEGPKEMLIPKNNLKQYMDAKKYAYYFANTQKAYFDHYCPTAGAEISKKEMVLPVKKKK